MTLWLSLDVDFAENAKLAKVPVACRWFHLAALCYCARNLTDGHISGRAVKVVAAIAETNARQFPAALVDAGLWHHDSGGDGYWINDYLEHQPSASEMKELREKRRAAGRLGGLASGQARAEALASKHLLEQTAEPPNPTQDLNPLTVSQSPSSYERGRDFSTLGKLKAACRAHGEDERKLERAAKGCTEAMIVAALEACKGPDVDSRLAVALSELKKRRNAA